MRYRLTLYLAAIAGLAGCAGSEIAQHPTDPNTPGAGQPQFATQVQNSYCSPLADTDIINEINNLFFKNSWPDANSALGKFKQVQTYLDAGDVTDARLATKNLVGFISLKFSQLTSAQQAASQADFDKLISDLWCFVGISGKVFDLNPGDPAKAFDIPGVGGVLFPANVVPVGTLVSLTPIPDTGICPITTVLDCFPGYLDIALYPNTTLPQLATVVLCPPSGITDPLAVGHLSSTGFELLPPASVPPQLATTCSTSSSQAEPTGWFGSLVHQAADWFLPKQLHASTYMFVGGVGGLVGSFSPFIISGTSATAGGTGGLVGSFTPPAASPGAAPALNPPLPSMGYLEDTVGAKKTNAVSVTIKTLGGDQNGPNPIPGVTVTFTTSAAQSYDPDSDAKVCDGQGNVPASGSISVTTDAQGVAKLPCLSFGTKAGYANLSATFDPTSLNFPGANQVTITATDANGGTSTSLNWLVVSDPGSAASIQTYMNGATAPSYSYGTGLTAFTNVSPAPQVIVTDTHGNVVPNQTVYWNATSTNGGVLTVGSTGTPTNATGTAQVASWMLGDGLNQATAGLFALGVTPPTGYQDALFSGSTPTGISVWACTATPGSKNDLGPMSIAAPNGSIKTVTIQMSITGTSSSISNYDATLQARLDGPTGGLLGTTAGKVQLPGDNGNPVPVTFVFPSYIGRQTGNHTIWFMLSVVAPSNRKPQVWYANQTFKSNDPCSGARLYAPGSSTTYVKGLWIDVTN
jgi:hypothetical protein